MGTYVLGKLSTHVLKINIFSIGKRYGVNNKTLGDILDDVSLEMPNTIWYI